MLRMLLYMHLARIVTCDPLTSCIMCRILVMGLLLYLLLVCNRIFFINIASHRAPAMCTMCQCAGGS